MRRSPGSTLVPYTTLFRSRARERPAARGRAGEHGRVLRAPPARRHDADAAAGSRRPPDARAQGQLLRARSEEHTSELQSRLQLVCRLLLEKKKKRSLMEKQ